MTALRLTHAPRFSEPRRRRARPRTQRALLDALESRLMLSSTVIAVAAGPITNITVGDDTRLQVYHTGFDNGQFYSSDSAPADAGFFIRESNGFVHGPASLDAGSNANSHGVTPVSQTLSPDGHTITTVFTNSTASGETLSFRVTQTVTYAPGTEYFRVTNVIENLGEGAMDFSAFSAGDIYLAGSDRGVGFYNASTGAIGGTDATGNYHIFNQPDSSTGLQPNHYQEANYSDVWSVIGAGAASNFDNTAHLPVGLPNYLTNSDPSYEDNGAGLEWQDQTIAGGQSATIAYYWAFGAIQQVAPPTTPTHAIFAIGTEAGQSSVVKVYDAQTKQVIYTLQPYVSDFYGGVRVATGDVNGDGTADIIVAPGPYSIPLVRVYNGATGQPLSSFYAYQQGYRNGVFVTTGDLNGDGTAQIITGTDQGGLPLVQAFSDHGALVRNFFAFNNSFTGGVRVATGDINGDASADIIAATGPGTTGQVRVFDGRNAQQLSGAVITPNSSWTGGLYAAAGNLTSDANDEIAVTFGQGGLPIVNIYNIDVGGATPVTMASNFYAYPLTDQPGYPGHPAYTGGVRIALTDIDGDGLAEILVGTGPQSFPYLRVFKGSDHTELKNLYVFPATWKNGFFVSAAVNTPLVTTPPVDTTPPADSIPS